MDYLYTLQMVSETRYQDLVILISPFMLIEDLIE